MTEEELITEARNHVRHFALNDGDGLRVGRLADALEAVTVERDRLKAAIEEALAPRNIDYGHVDQAIEKVRGVQDAALNEGKNDDR